MARPHEDPRAPARVALDRHSPLPLYEQIKRRVLSMILSWQNEETRFHTDQELSEQFGVSRMTVRQAVSELVAEGYLRRMRGLGTFVCAPRVDEQFTPAMDFLHQSASKGRPLQLRVLRCEQQPASRELAHSLGLETGAPVWHVIRLRTVQDVPISLDYRYLDAARITRLGAEEVSNRSLLDLIAQFCELSHADLRVEVGTARAEHADFLSLVPDEPVLVRHLQYYDDTGRRVMSGVSYYRADQVSYSVRVPLALKGQGERRIADRLDVRGAASSETMET